MVPRTFRSIFLMLDSRSSLSFFFFSQEALPRQKFQEPLEISWPGNGAKASLAIFSARTLLLRYSCGPKVAFLRSISWMTCCFVNFPTVTFASTKSSRICLRKSEYSSGLMLTPPSLSPPRVITIT